MNRSIWRYLVPILVVVLLSAVLLKSGYPAVAGLPSSTIPQANASTGPAAPGAPGTSSQGTAVQVMPTSGEPLDLQPSFTNEAGPSAITTPQATAVSESVAPGTSSQGTQTQLAMAPGEPQDDPALFASIAATSRFYNIPGSVLMPVDSATTLAYDYMGCIHAKTGGGNLLNAPLNLPEGSTLIGIRLYYVDSNATTDVNAWITRYNLDGTDFDDLVSVMSSGDAGRGNVWGDVDPTMNVVDTYSWRYVLNGRVNSATNTLQICGIRVMYTPPPGCCTYIPSVMRQALP